MNPYLCPRCDGTGKEPDEGPYPGWYTGDTPPPEPCTVCSGLALYSLASGAPILSPARGSVPVCMACGCRIEWIDSPYGGWWAHLIHPVDEHDAKPVTQEDVANCTTHDPVRCVDSCCPWPTPGF